MNTKEYYKKYYKDNKVKMNEAAKQWRNKNPERWRAVVRNAQLKHLYGTNQETYALLLEKQKGLCAICFKPCSTGNKLAVDHNHANNKIRGLLCFACNTGIGKLKEDILILKSAINYLENN